MKARFLPGTVVLTAWMLLNGVAFALAQQTRQPAGGGTGSATSAPASATNIPDTRSNRQDKPQMQREPILYVSGSVAMEDGAPPPLGTVVERTCAGRTSQEAYVASNGSFSFQLGATSRLVPDASESAPATNWDSSGGLSGAFPDPGSGSRSGMIYNGCEIRARLGGYRSSQYILMNPGDMGIIEVGTLILYPVSRITGTTVSLTEMQAPSKARKALAQAGKALQKDKLDEAEKSIKEALDLCPKYAPAWLLLGRVYQREKRTDEARTAFTKAVAADEKFVSPLIELARMAGMETNWKETADLADRALELDPADFPEAYFLSAVAGYNQNHFDLAEKNARRAQVLDYRHQFPEAFLLLGRILHEKRDSAGEAEQLRNFLKYAPQSPNSVQVRAELQELERTHPDLMARSKQPK